MDYSDLDRKVPFDKSDSELESDDDGDEASKKRSFKKIANTEPDLLHLPGTSEFTQLYLARTGTSNQFVATEEEIVVIAMPIERQGE